jgi:protein TonB
MKHLLMLCVLLCSTTGGTIAQTQPQIPKRIRVGSKVMQGKLVYQVPPSYPIEARRAGIQGTVSLEVVISKEGKVMQVKLLDGPPSLVKPATQAVWKWRYQPTLLNGVPLEVVTEVDVHFKLSAR